MRLRSVCFGHTLVLWFDGQGGPQISPVRTDAFFACLTVGRVLKPDLSLLGSLFGTPIPRFQSPPSLGRRLAGGFLLLGESAPSRFLYGNLQVVVGHRNF